MKTDMKSIGGMLTIALIVLVTSSSVKAIPNPNAIKWTAKPDIFVKSLYVAVYGKRVASTTNISKLTRLVDHTGGSRWSMFWRFVNYKGYQQSKWGKQKKTYSLYYHTLRAGAPCFRVARASTRVVSGGKIYGSVTGGPYSYSVALAVMGYHRAFLTGGKGDACLVGSGSSKKAPVRKRTPTRIRGCRWQQKPGIFGLPSGYECVCNGKKSSSKKCGPYPKRK